MTEALAYTIAGGARAAGVAVDVRRVPPEDASRLAHEDAPIADAAALPGYDAIIVGMGAEGAVSSFLGQAAALLGPDGCGRKFATIFNPLPGKAADRDAPDLAGFAQLGLTVLPPPAAAQGQGPAKHARSLGTFVACFLRDQLR